MMSVGGVFLDEEQTKQLEWLLVETFDPQRLLLEKSSFDKIVEEAKR